MSAATAHRPPHAGYPGREIVREVRLGFDPAGPPIGRFGVAFTVLESHVLADGTRVIDRLEILPCPECRDRGSGTTFAGCPTCGRVAPR